MPTPPAPNGFATINPFIITRGADELTKFLIEVFDGLERREARTIDADDLLLHAELQIGDSTVMLAERKPDWPFTPALLQVYVEDVELTLQRAQERGAEIITQPTDFFGAHIFSRFLDPWQNLWWVYSAPATTEAEADDDADWAGDTEEWAGDTEEWDSDGTDWQPTPELTYIHDTLITALPRLRDPHAERLR